MDDVLKIDQNNKSTTGFVTDDSNQFIRNARIDDTTKGLKVMVVGSSSGLVAPVILNNATLSSAFTINQTNAANSSGELILNNSGTGHALQIIQNGAIPASRSVGGAVLVSNGTTNTGNGIVVYTNVNATSTGRLVHLTADNVAYPNEVLYVDSDSQTNTAFGIVCHNHNQGVIKLTHIHDTGDSSDSNAAGISIDLQSQTSHDTAVQGIFMTSTTGGTTGNLLELRNNLLAFGGADAQIPIFSVLGDGHIGIQNTTPTAWLNLPAGTATATQAPLKFTAGTNLATTEAGAIEYDGTHLYFTALNAGARYQLDHPVNRNQLRVTGAGFVTENFPIGGATASGLMVTQTVYYALNGFFKGDIITNINVEVVTQGTTTTSVFVAVLDSSGNRLAISNDLTTALDSTGMKSLALSAPYTILTDGAYYLAVLTINGTPANCATLIRGNGTGASQVGVGSGARMWSNQTGQTTIPTTATLGAGTFGYWIAAS